MAEISPARNADNASRDAYKVPKTEGTKKKRLVGVRYSGGRIEGAMQEAK